MTLTREVPEREGRPIVGVDLGGGRAWSAACGMLRQCGATEGVEARAVAPGIPDLDESQEIRDAIGYRLAPIVKARYDLGQLGGCRGPDESSQPAAMWDLIRTAWGKPQVVVLDRFRLAEFEDAVKRGARLEPRVSQVV